jgi:uncharacterized protein YdeI (YjbR/CyaY-like superfamily)
MKPKFFKTPADFRKWLEKNHDKEAELLVGFYKTGSGKQSITWPESVEQALCFGWIDGVRRSIDDESYSIRFTPRRKNSIWSAVNIKKVAELKEKGLMMPAGLEAFGHRKEEKSKVYSFENKDKGLDEEMIRTFKANKKAWTFFQSQAPWYQRTVSWWVISAKKEDTREKRLRVLIEDSANGKRIGAVLSPKQKKS